MEGVKYESVGIPPKSGVYMVDRDTLQKGQGQAFRYFNMETGKWGITTYDPAEAYALRDNESALPFLPFHPVAVKFKQKTIAEVVKMIQSQPDNIPASVRAADARILKAVTKQPVKAPKVKAKATKAPKVVHPDGTVFFREDRQKWVVVIDGKQPAARPTKDGVVKWLASKHPTIVPSFL